MLEASLLSVPRSYVETMAQRQLGWAERLRRMNAHVDRPLSAILTLNTVAHTVGAAGVGAQAANAFGSAVVGVASAAMTVLILVLSEIVPKTLGATHAKGLAPLTTHAIRAMMVLTWPILVVLEQINRRLGRAGNQAALSRAEISATLHLGRQAGAINADEYRTVRNLITLDQVSVRKVLTPRTVVMALPEDQTVDEALAEHETFPFARLPVYRGKPDEVTGYVMRSRIYEAGLAGRQDQKLADLARPIRAVPEQASVDMAMNLLLAHREHILLVVDEFGGVEGIVTLEDALETLLGQEIVDETDRSVDLRALARRRAAQRDPKAPDGPVPAQEKTWEGRPRA
jgi:CBS domain containing-hemolysin-like protein